MPPFNAAIDGYERESEDLFDRLTAGDEPAEWHVKWMHPRFRGKTIADVRTASLTSDDARLVVAQDYGFDTWSDLDRFVASVAHDPGVFAFESAVESVIAGDAASLGRMLALDPRLAAGRSRRRHHATLLHYVGANGVEQSRQRTPPNAVAITTQLLDAGAEPDALAHLYEEPCTTLTMLVSSSPPDEAGLQTPLALALLDGGASVVDPGTNVSAVLTALKFGYLGTARAIAARWPARPNVVEAAGLGVTEEVARLRAVATAGERQAALSLAAQHGHAEAVRLLLTSGADPDRYNPDGFHSHTTPLHQAVWAGHQHVVAILVDAGARLDVRDTIYGSTPLEWAVHGKRTALADYLRSRDAAASG
jgi:hypothetical protein